MANDTFTVVVTGGAEIERWLNGIGEAAETVLEDAVNAAAEVVREAADELAPSANSIVKETAEKSQTRCEVDVTLDDDKWHYKFLETGAQAHTILPDEAGALMFPEAANPFGIAHHPGFAARPFLRPAADRNEDEATDAAGDSFRQAMG